MIAADAGTTWAKIIEQLPSKLMLSCRNYKAEYFIKEEKGCRYYVMPSQELKNTGIKFDRASGHMTLNLIKDKKGCENEVIALIQGFRKNFSVKDAVILDMGSRDIKCAVFKNGRFKDLDWNTGCSSSTGASIEMLLKFYNINPEDLVFSPEKYVITCGIFGFEKIMDDISKGVSAKLAVSKFIHGIAFNAWNFAKRPNKIYLSGGFCENQCFIKSLQQYCETEPAGRFLLAEGLI